MVVNGYRSEDAALQIVEEIRTPGAEAVAVQGDVADLDALENLFQQCIDTFGKPDIMVAHAGAEIVDQPISEVTKEQFDRLLAVNTKGAFFTLQKTARHINDHGRIVCIGSRATSLANPGVGLYGSSKMFAAGRPLEGRFGTPEDVADAAEYFAGPLARRVSGQHLLISGGAPAVTGGIPLRPTDSSGS